MIQHHESQDNPADVEVVVLRGALRLAREAIDGFRGALETLGASKTELALAEGKLVVHEFRDGKGEALYRRRTRVPDASQVPVVVSEPGVSSTTGRLPLIERGVRLMHVLQENPGIKISSLPDDLHHELYRGGVLKGLKRMGVPDLPEKGKPGIEVGNIVVFLPGLR